MHTRKGHRVGLPHGVKPCRSLEASRQEEAHVEEIIKRLEYLGIVLVVVEKHVLRCLAAFDLRAKLAAASLHELS